MMDDTSSLLDEDDLILLVEVERYFMKYYDFLGKADAFRLFEKFGQTASRISSVERRKVFIQQKLAYLKQDLGRAGCPSFSFVLITLNSQFMYFENCAPETRVALDENLSQDNLPTVEGDHSQGHFFDHC